MSAQTRIYQQVEDQIKQCAGASVRITSVRRLAALVMGILASEQCVLRRVARELTALGLRPAQEASTGRRLRRTMADLRLDTGVGYGALVQAAVDWPVATPVVLVLDESTTPGGLHVLRLSLAYRGSCLPLAWTVWRHQEKLPHGAYWRSIDQVLARAAAIVPPHLRIVVLADRAYDVPPLLDRLAALGWDWIIRVKARSKMVWRGADGAERPLRALVEAHLDRPGTHFRATGETFKKAGWRAVNLVGEWGRGYAEPLVVLTNLDPCWTVLSRSARRFWIEPAFRHDKSKGWDWEQSQVRDPARQERLLLALAWATLLALSLGAQHAATAVATFAARTGRLPKPSHPRDSLFRLGLGQFRAWLYGTVRGRLPWHLPHLTHPSWCAEWLALHQPMPPPQSVLP
jgi:hypothetical protein